MTFGMYEATLTPLHIDRSLMAARVPGAMSPVNKRRSLSLSTGSAPMFSSSIHLKRRSEQVPACGNLHNAISGNSSSVDFRCPVKTQRYLRSVGPAVAGKSGPHFDDPTLTTPKIDHLRMETAGRDSPGLFDCPKVRARPDTGRSSTSRHCEPGSSYARTSNTTTTLAS